MTKDLLIIFAKNPILGEVKTRIAATMGEEKALAIYYFLLTHTANVTDGLSCDKAVYYSNYIDYEDKWDNNIYQKFLQKGDDLGIRIEQAFDKAFEDQYQKVCIIGTDCLEINSEIIQSAFGKLENHDAVIGPAVDGGYYLLGIKKPMSELFKNKNWGSSGVLESTLSDFSAFNKQYFLLPMLNDIDTEADWSQIKQ